ncbi:MAG TPA: OmpW family outer membrane protein [Thermoanaerobaculia bacterium]|jgi:opacity protein-like surface antigen|nr:OmpW family outer membrane protein [Thermoanaerobaculia bacterium]
MIRAAIALFLLALPLRAADLELGMRHISSSPRANGAFGNNEIDVEASRGFAATAEVFWTSRVSTQLAGTFVNPPAFIFPEDMDLGTFGIDTYSLTARYHLAPDARFSAFAGGGAAIVIFGDLEDRFADDIEMTFDRETALLVEGGLRYRASSRVVIDVAVSYMPLEATPNHVRNDTTVPLPESVKLDPLMVSVGAAWRF